MILSGGMGFLAFSFMQQIGGERPPIPEEAPFQFSVMDVIFQHFGLIAMVQVAFAIFIMVKQINKAKKKEAEAPPAPTEKECPHCLTKIAIKATRCPNCTSELQAA